MWNPLLGTAQMVDRQVRSLCEVWTSNNSAPYPGKTAVNGAGKWEPAEVDSPPEGGSANDPGLKQRFSPQLGRSIELSKKR